VFLEFLEGEGSLLAVHAVPALDLALAAGGLVLVVLVVIVDGGGLAVAS